MNSRRYAQVKKCRSDPSENYAKTEKRAGSIQKNDLILFIRPDSKALVNLG